MRSSLQFMGLQSGLRCHKVKCYCLVLQGKSAETLKSCFQKRLPRNGLKTVKLLHDDAPSHKATIVAKFLEDENKSLPCPIHPIR